MKNLIASLALAAAALGLGSGCAKNFESDPYIAFLNAGHLGATVTDMRASNKAQTDLLGEYYRLDAARRHLAVERKYEWVASRRDSFSAAEALALARAYRADSDDVRAILADQWGNIKALERLGEANAENIHAYARAQRDRVAAEQRSAQRESEALQAFAAETAAVVQEAWVARELRDQREALPPSEPEPEHVEPEQPAPPAEPSGEPNLQALLNRF